MHTDLVIVEDVDMLKKPLHGLQKKLAAIYGNPISKQFTFGEKFIRRVVAAATNRCSRTTC